MIEAVDLLFAGSDTIASTTTTGVLAILQDPQVHQKLVDELKNVQADENGELPLLELEKLDYLVRGCFSCPSLDSPSDINHASRLPALRNPSELGWVFLDVCPVWSQRISLRP